MIEPEDYRMPHKAEPKRKPTAEERRREQETVGYLNSLPWKPFTCDW